VAKRIIRDRRLTADEARRDQAARAPFARRPSKQELLATGDYFGPMRIDEYLTWRRGDANAPLAKQLQAALRSCGRSVSAIAQSSGVPQPVVQRFVTGERGITLETAGKLAAYLGLSLQPDPSPSK
jgi:hypothetical protein